MSKNILVFGGGTPNKFGNMFVSEARKAGHRVMNVSHQDYVTYNPDDFVLEYAKYYNEEIDSLCRKIANGFEDKIDLILFNQNPSAYPFTIDHIHEEPNIILYFRLIIGHMVIPHFVLSKLNEKLSNQCRVVFLASVMSWDYDIDHPAVGYPGIKSMIVHFMKKLAKFRKNQVTFSAIHPKLILDNPNFYQNFFLPLYNHLLNHDDSVNGKILEIDNQGIWEYKISSKRELL